MIAAPAEEGAEPTPEDFRPRPNVASFNLVISACEAAGQAVTMHAAAAPMMTRYDTHEPKKKASEAQSTAAASSGPWRRERPMYECSRTCRQLFSKKERAVWLSAKTRQRSRVPSTYPQRENARGSASRPGPVVALSRLKVVPSRASALVSATSKCGITMGTSN